MGNVWMGTDDAGVWSLPHQETILSKGSESEFREQGSLQGRPGLNIQLGCGCKEARLELKFRKSIWKSSRGTRNRLN